MKRRVWVGAALVGLSLAAGRAAAAETLIPRERHVTRPQLSVSAAGDAVAAWSTDNRKYDIVFPARNVFAGYRAKVRVALGSIDSGFPVQQTLAVVHRPGLGGPLLAGDELGDAIVAWQDDRHRLRYAMTRLGHRFGPPRTAARNAAPRQLVAAPDGHFALAWTQNRSLRAAAGTADHGFGRSFRIPGHGDDSLDLAVNRRGTVAAVVEGYSTVHAWLRRSGGDVRGAGRVPGWTTSGVQARLQPDDTIVALLSGYKSEVGTAVSYRVPGGRFTKPRHLDRTGTFPELAVDPSGAITAAWTLYNADGEPRGVGASTAPPDGRFKRVIRFRRVGGWGGSVAAAGKGHRLVLFEQNGSRRGRPARLRALAYGRHGGFARPATVAKGEPFEHAVGVADDGRGLAVWNVERGGSEGGLFFARIGARAVAR